jgi:hypothetical protein
MDSSTTQELIVKKSFISPLCIRVIQGERNRYIHIYKSTTMYSVCIYNLFASIVTPDDEKREKKKEKRSKLLYIFLSSLDLTAHPILFYSRWGNLRALTKWESIISVPFNPVARRSPPLDSSHSM